MTINLEPKDILTTNFHELDILQANIQTCRYINDNVQPAELLPIVYLYNTPDKSMRTWTTWTQRIKHIIRAACHMSEHDCIHKETVRFVGHFINEYMKNFDAPPSEPDKIQEATDTRLNLLEHDVKDIKNIITLWRQS